MPQTFGQHLVNRVLPSDLQAKGVIDSKELNRRLYTLARKDPARAAKTMDQIRQLGHEIATTEGASITLNDITPDYQRRDEVLHPALAQLKRTDNPDTRRRIILDAQDKMAKATKHFGGTQKMMVESGTRGKPVQLMRSFMSPIAARTAEGDAFPWMIRKSYSEGLPPSDHFAASMESRNNLISANLAITEPGDFSKILVNNMGDQLILDDDCGTHNGIAMSSDDPNIIDRFLVKPAAGFRSGTQVTPQVYSRLRKDKKVGDVIVRSPMTCEHGDGICQKCQGLDERGQLHRIGTNVGIRSAQAITEPLTQFTLSARHGVRAAGSDAAKIKSLKGVRQFLEIPKTFANKAALSDTDGTVEDIQKAPQGGFNINVGGHQHYVPPHLKPTVSKGQAVAAGDALSEGIPMPNEVVQYKGMGVGRKYMVDQLHEAYKGQGIDVDKRHLEILAKTHLNKVQIDDDPEDRFYPGEVVNFPNMMKRLSEDVENVGLGQAKGRVLAKNYLHHMAGTTVTPEISKDLKKHGVGRVAVAKAPPRVSFMMQSIVSNPLLNPDWLARMAHRKLKQTVMEGAHFGERSDIHGTHPVPAYVHGTEFGKGRGGRY
jgi:DNA-directed RNA polymerase subunit beta'